MPPYSTGTPTRRQWLHGTAFAGWFATQPVWAQTSTKPAASKAATGPAIASVAQVIDMSAAQQDVSRDLLVGAQAAWKDFNARGGLRGRPVQHVALETDGSPASLEAAWKTVRADANCVALAGCAGNSVALGLLDLQRKAGSDSPLAHVAPWLQSADVVLDDATFPVFADRHAQIEHAVTALSVAGVREVGVVYASRAAQTGNRAELERISQGLKLQLQTIPTANTVEQTAQTLGPKTPSMLLFIGGTPELAQFLQGIKKQGGQRFVVALADVNLQTLAQLGSMGRNASVVVTQAVPMVNAGLPVVRAYRDALARYYDEAPTPLGLAGFIAARYTAQVLASLDTAPTRQNVLAAFQRRNTVDVGGFQVQYDKNRRSGYFVTQSMLASDGRVVG